MCQHDDFDILYYQHGILVRRCKHCGELEVRTEYWVRTEHLVAALHAVEESP